MSAYVIQHNLVGLHHRGDVVRFCGAALPIGVDVERLVRLGAVREATASEAEDAVDYGNVQNDIPRPFPTVPFQPPVSELATGELAETTAQGPDSAEGASTNATRARAKK